MELGLSYIKSLINWGLDIVFPEKCIGCNQKSSILCLTCITNIRRAERETSTSIVAAYDYRDPLIKRAIWNLKYYHQKRLGIKLGEMLYDSLLEEVSDLRSLTKGQPICVIPVPITRNRQKTRGYNQAEIIARGFCESEKSGALNLKKNIISKKVNTLPQARITNRIMRLKNIHGAFEINNIPFIKGRTTIVIDDVTTTGGTMKEIIKLLKEHGAKKVIGFAVAH